MYCTYTVHILYMYLDKRSHQTSRKLKVRHRGGEISLIDEGHGWGSGGLLGGGRWDHREAGGWLAQVGQLKGRSSLAVVVVLHYRAGLTCSRTGTLQPPEHINTQEINCLDNVHCRNVGSPDVSTFSNDSKYLITFHYHLQPCQI